MKDKSATRDHNLLTKAITKDRFQKAFTNNAIDTILNSLTVYDVQHQLEPYSKCLHFMRINEDKLETYCQNDLPSHTNIKIVKISNASQYRKYHQ